MHARPAPSTSCFRAVLGSSLGTHGISIGFVLAGTWADYFRLLGRTAVHNGYRCPATIGTLTDVAVILPNIAAATLLLVNPVAASIHTLTTNRRYP